MQRTANPRTSVRFRLRPPKESNIISNRLWTWSASQPAPKTCCSLSQAKWPTFLGFPRIVAIASNPRNTKHPEDFSHVCPDSVIAVVRPTVPMISAAREPGPYLGKARRCGSRYRRPSLGVQKACKGSPSAPFAEGAPLQRVKPSLPTPTRAVPTPTRAMPAAVPRPVPAAVIACPTPTIPPAGSRRRCCRGDKTSPDKTNSNGCHCQPVSDHIPHSFLRERGLNRVSSPATHF